MSRPLASSPLDLLLGIASKGLKLRKVSSGGALAPTSYLLDGEIGAGKYYPYIYWYIARSDDKYIFSKWSGELSQIKKFLNSLNISPVKLVSLEMQSQKKLISDLSVIKNAGFKLSRDSNDSSLIYITFTFPIGIIDCMESITVCRSYKSSSENFPRGEPASAPSHPNDTAKFTSQYQYTYPLIYSHAGFGVGSSYNGFKSIDFKIQYSVSGQPASSSYTTFKEFPLPGECVSIACRPASHRGYSWFNQDTSPFAYSGCWFETKYLSSGVIERILSSSDSTQELKTTESDPNALLEVRCKDFLYTGDYEKFISEYNEAIIKTLPEKDKEDAKDKNYLYVVSTDYYTYKKNETVALLLQSYETAYPDVADSPLPGIPYSGDSLMNVRIKDDESVKLPYRLLVVPYDFCRRFKEINSLS